MNHIYTVFTLIIAAGWIYGYVHVSKLFLVIPSLLVFVAILYAVVYNLVKDAREQRNRIKRSKDCF